MQKETLPDYMRKIFVGGVTAKTDEDTLKAYFGPYGNITDCIVMKDPVTQRSRGFAFVTYDSMDGVDQVQKARPHTLDDKTVETKRVMPRLLEGKAETKTLVKSIFLGGYKDQVSEEDLSEYFGRYDGLKGVEIAVEKATGKKKGYAFIHFEDHDAVDKCILESAQMKDRKILINGIRMEVKKALSGDELRKQTTKTSWTPSSAGGTRPGGSYGGGTYGGPSGGAPPYGGPSGGNQGYYGHTPYGPFAGNYGQGGGPPPPPNMGGHNGPAPPTGGPVPPPPGAPPVPPQANSVNNANPSGGQGNNSGAGNMMPPPMMGNPMMGMMGNMGMMGMPMMNMPPQMMAAMMAANMASAQAATSGNSSTNNNATGAPSNSGDAASSGTTVSTTPATGQGQGGDNKGDSSNQTSGSGSSMNNMGQWNPMAMGFMPPMMAAGMMPGMMMGMPNMGFPMMPNMGMPMPNGVGGGQAPAANSSQPNATNQSTAQGQTGTQQQTTSQQWPPAPMPGQGYQGAQGGGPVKSEAGGVYGNPRAAAAPYSTGGR